MPNNSLSPQNKRRIMNKKVYTKPELAVEEVKIETLMLTDSLILNEEGGKEEALSTGRRGTWGNLWAGETEEK